MNLVDEKLLAALLRKEQQVEAQIALANTSANFLLVLDTFVPAQIALLHSHLNAGTGHGFEAASIIAAVSAICAALGAIWPRKILVTDTREIEESLAGARQNVPAGLLEATFAQANELAAERFTELEVVSCRDRVDCSERVLSRKQTALVVALWLTLLSLAAGGFAALTAIHRPSQTYPASALPAPAAVASAPAAPPAEQPPPSAASKNEDHTDVPQPAKHLPRAKSTRPVKKIPPPAKARSATRNRSGK